MAASSSTGLVLKSVKKVVVRFCPFEVNVRSAREFLESINAKKVRSTNINCEITADVRHDKSEPAVDILFADGERMVMKTANLTTKEMLTALKSKCVSKDLQAKENIKK
ncbi:39S ribosomal protein L53, mitochondrial [Bombina bombina]|uniref:39S ribosomal protein L53, mitochondrial n=1 Tax=Bombina bombina TaxID=8345 RepID=UPI00235AD1EE|nr:39S ribosomal protein L53, mitochondrial [Bombina bombina]